MIKPLAAALIFGVMAALLAALYLNSLETTYKKEAQKVKVLTAKEYIDQGTLLGETLVEEKLVPKEYIQPKTIGSIKELFSPEGKKIFMAIVPFEKGEQITTTKLVLLGLDTGISSVIPSQKRAITLLMDSSVIYGIIKPGNRVDVIGIIQFEDKSGQMQETAFTILQNILVLAAGNNMLGTAVTGMKASEKTGVMAMMQEVPSAGIPVSLSVSPKEAEVVALTAERGVVKLSLRPVGDDDVIESKGTNLRDLSKDISQVLKVAGGSSQVSVQNAREIQKNQREVIELLKKYKKN